MKVFVAVFVCITFFATGELPRQSSATYENEKLICNKTEAISRIEKIPVDGPNGKDYSFKIHCVPLNICNETCEWSDRCTTKYYGEGVYLGGIHSLFYTPTEQRYLALLCCNSSEVEYNSSSKANGPFTNYTGGSYVVQSYHSEILRQARVNHKTEYSLWLTVQICQYNTSQSQASAAVAAVAESRSEAGVSLAGLAGLSGLAALQFAACDCNPGRIGLPCSVVGSSSPMNANCLGQITVSCTVVPGLAAPICSP